MKYILIILLLLFIILAGIYIINSSNPKPNQVTLNTNPITPTITEIIPKLNTEPEEIVQAFYDWYIKCSLEGGNCDVQNQPSVDADKINSVISKARGYSPIVCAQNIPESYRVEKTASNNGEKAIVHVAESFGNGAEQRVILELTKVNDLWRITNISCPLP